MDRNNRSKQLTEILKQLSLLTQLGLSMLTPTILCLGICYWTVKHFHAGYWVYLIGFFFGLGGSGMVAWKFYKQTCKDTAKEERSRRSKVSFNRHD